MRWVRVNRENFAEAYNSYFLHNCFIVCTIIRTTPDQIVTRFDAMRALIVEDEPLLNEELEEQLLELRSIIKTLPWLLMVVVKECWKQIVMQQKF